MIKVFISYAWESAEHKEKIEALATRLRTEAGVDATFDDWDLKVGDPLTAYMENMIVNSDFVLMICTPTYKAKVDNRLGGSGYEGNLIATNILYDNNRRKFLPILMDGSRKESIPNFMDGNVYLDISQKDDFWSLVATLRGIEKDIPPVQEKTDSEIKQRIQENSNKLKSKLETNQANHDDELKITGIIADKITDPSNDGTRGSALYKIPFQLSKTPPNDWKRMFIEKWDSPSRFTSMHRPGIATIQKDIIWLNGTTIEEVKQYHRDTLKLALKEANTAYKQLLIQEARIQQAYEEKEKQREKHRKTVADIASHIKF